MEILDTLSTSKYDTQASPQQVLTPRGKIDDFASLKGDQDYFNLYAKLVNMNNNVIPFSEKPTQVPSRFQSEFRQEANECIKQILADEKSIELKLEAITDKHDLLEQLRAKMRETLMRIEPKRLAQVKADKIKGLNYLFESFFHVYYKESSEEFSWSKFKQSAVVKDQLKDFKSRLANIDLKTLTADDKITLGKMREDRWFDAILIAQYEGGVLQQLMNYLGFINQAIKTQNEIDTLHKEIDQMRKNLVNLRAKAEQCEKEEEIWETVDSYFDDINEETEMSNEPGQYRKNIQLMLMKETTRTPFNTMQKLRK